MTDELQLNGRIDRVDVRVDDAGIRAVLDYKTQAVSTLRNKLKAPGEDVQLACYAQAAGAAEAAFVSLEDDKVVAVAPPGDIAELARLNTERLATVFGQLRSGTPMPAHGAETVCGYCEMKGLCRRGEWPEKQDQGLRNQDQVVAGVSGG